MRIGFIDGIDLSLKEVFDSTKSEINRIYLFIYLFILTASILLFPGRKATSQNIFVGLYNASFYILYISAHYKYLGYIVSTNEGISLIYSQNYRASHAGT